MPKFREPITLLQPIANTSDEYVRHGRRCRVLAGTGSRADGDIARADARGRTVQVFNPPAGLGSLWQAEVLGLRWQVDDVFDVPTLRKTVRVDLSTNQPSGDEA